MPFRIDLEPIYITVGTGGTAAGFSAMMVRSRCSGLYAYRDQPPDHGWNVIELSSATMTADKTSVDVNETVNVSLSGSIEEPMPGGFVGKVFWHLYWRRQGEAISHQKSIEIDMTGGQQTFSDSVQFKFAHEGKYKIWGFVEGAVLQTARGECGGWHG